MAHRKDIAVGIGTAVAILLLGVVIVAICFTAGVWSAR